MNKMSYRKTVTHLLAPVNKMHIPSKFHADRRSFRRVKLEKIDILLHFEFSKRVKAILLMSGFALKFGTHIEQKTLSDDTTISAIE